MKALVLFAHGARDVRWAEPFERLRDMLRLSSDQPVELAYLELMQPDLTTAVNGLVNQGVTALTIVPIFFGQGGHVRRDLPERIATLRLSHPHLKIDCADAVGEDTEVLAAIANYCRKQQ